MNTLQAVAMRREQREPESDMRESDMRESDMRESDMRESDMRESDMRDPSSEDNEPVAPVEEAIMQMLKEVVPRRLHNKLTIDENTVLTDLGINSMAKISLAFRIEQALGIDLSSMGEEVARAHTVRDVIQLIRRGHRG